MSGGQWGSGHKPLRGQSAADSMLADRCEATAAMRRTLGSMQERMGTMGEILVVDDDTRMRALVAKVLAREGYAVRALPRAQDVLQVLEEESVDLIISDIRMPDMDS